MSNQFTNSIAIGTQSGNTTQGTGGGGAIAIGPTSGFQNQAASAIAIGSSAGATNQGLNSIAIGKAAGNSNQAQGSIVLNASGNALNASTTGTFINPIRLLSGQTGASLFLNTTTNEIFGAGYPAIQLVTYDNGGTQSVSASSNLTLSFPTNYYTVSQSFITPQATSTQFLNNTGQTIYVSVAYSISASSTSTGVFNVSIQNSADGFVVGGQSVAIINTGVSYPVSGSGVVRLTSGTYVFVVVTSSIAATVSIAASPTLSILRLG